MGNCGWRRRVSEYLYTLHARLVTCIDRPIVRMGILLVASVGNHLYVIDDGTYVPG